MPKRTTFTLTSRHIADEVVPEVDLSFSNRAKYAIDATNKQSLERVS